MDEIIKNPHEDSQIIDALGGTNETASLCKVTPAAVSQWRFTGIPQARRMFLQVIKPKLFKVSPRSD